jgi:4-hydroxy-3-polyprenylbenzoate decarboxylase
MPAAGVAHNLVVVKINKTYPGQGKKVISSLFGTGQMMFTKYLVVVSGNIDIRNYRELLLHVFENTDFRSDLLFTSGPLDVLDHSSDSFAMGGKLGIDGTEKLKEELSGRSSGTLHKVPLSPELEDSLKKKILETNSIVNIINDLPVVIVGLNQNEDALSSERSRKGFRGIETRDIFRLILAVDNTICTLLHGRYLETLILSVI